MPWAKSVSIECPLQPTAGSILCDNSFPSVILCLSTSCPQDKHLHGTGYVCHPWRYLIFQLGKPQHSEFMFLQNHTALEMSGQQVAKWCRYQKHIDNHALLVIILNLVHALSLTCIISFWGPHHPVLGAVFLWWYWCMWTAHCPFQSSSTPIFSLHFSHTLRR
jgi:hypothetical protein